MEKHKDVLLEQVQEFELVFEKYFKAFMEYLKGGILKDSEYVFNHPTLFQLSNKLQVVYLKLPAYLRKRLMDLEFEVFLHCNNVVDFYSFRIFLLENQRFQRTSTIAERVTSEIDLAKLLIENGTFETYIKLPKRNFEFYREQAQYKIMNELYEKRLESEKSKEISAQNYTVNESGNGLEKDKELPKRDDFFDTAMEKVGKAGTILDSADNIVGKTFNLIKALTNIGKLF
ncbi:hypothetical protein MOE50_14305 [Bacillus inaquosorum]|uniref:hypothetical protein n=1 Tax=Bacillus inaquosorum TaxID=483913 RepID=UPI0022829A10|nr:hypothetical protein [Bacillus inaquosorum]MCY9010139.1 hypothetical protein [Bacillus inaquosorum]MCY9028051.1 hypothetical protein [Bacillus inaquosorum]MCY9035719.1 hypothetical protein [Bacillus inaquosorum]MCY9047084.1 hypothetical protein [Bacillus inaquosorum]